MTLEKEQLVNTVNDNKESYESQIEALSSQIQILERNDQLVISSADSHQDSTEETASKVTESIGHVVKDSTTGAGNMFHCILGEIGGTIQWCIILLIILVLVYINRATILKFCKRKSSDLTDQATKSSTDPLTSTITSPPTLSTNSHSSRKGFNNPTPAPDHIFYPWYLQVSPCTMILLHKRSLVWSYQ